MGKIAFLFAGQGAQTPGMGKSLYETSAAAAKVFDAMEAQRPGTKADCFEAEAERLMQTSVTQPCVYTVDLASAAALAEAGVVAQGAAGFSLGEMAALTFAGVFTAEDGARLVCRRGELMEQAAQETPGAMAAVMRMQDEQVEELCAKFEGVWPVNYNCPGQIVVAGKAEAIPAFCDAVKEAGGMARPLAVGGGFHTPLMAKAAEKFAAELADTAHLAPSIPVYANTNAQPYGADINGTLAAQMHNPVRWHNTITQMLQDGFDTFVELGPGKTLSGFMKRIAPDAVVCNVNDAETLAAALEILK